MNLSVALTGLAATALISTTLLDVPTILVWNASPSVPVGLYAILPIGTPTLGNLALIEPSADLMNYLSRRGYLPRGTPILKRVAALPGHEVCRIGSVVRIDGQLQAIAQKHDAEGRSLPRWSGCHRLQSDEVSFLNSAPDSLDGRYFGALKLDVIRGRAVPLWTSDRH